jgi:hypothetical protein
MCFLIVAVLHCKESQLPVKSKKKIKCATLIICSDANNDTVIQKELQRVWHNYIGFL